MKASVDWKMQVTKVHDCKWNLTYQNSPTHSHTYTFLTALGAFRALLAGFGALSKNLLLHGNVLHCEELRFGPLSCAEEL